MKRDSMVFYRSFADGIEDLEEKDQLKAFWNIIRYGLDGTEPGEGGPARSVFRMARPQIDMNNDRYIRGLSGGKKPNANQSGTKPEPNDNQTGTKPEPNRNQTGTKPEPNVNQSETKSEPNVNVNENVKKENSLAGVKEKRFAPPTPDEVREYARQNGYDVDADRFVNFYESKGWMIGKNRMKDWRAAVRNWARSERQGMAADAQRQGMAAKPSTNRFRNFDEHGYDYELISNQIGLNV